MNIKTLVLLAGVLVAFAVMCGPVLKQYVPCPLTQCEQKDQQEEQEETKVSALEAVAPVVQAHTQFGDFVIEVLDPEHNTEQTRFSSFVGEIPQKLFKVLFRWIISPNAP